MSVNTENCGTGGKKIMTNFEAVCKALKRKNTDKEELFQALNSLLCPEGEQNCDNDGNCRICWEKWFDKEAEEE